MKINRPKIAYAFSVTDEAIRNPGNEAVQRAARVARVATFVNLAESPDRSFLAIHVRVGDVFHTGPDRQGRLALSTAEHAGSIILATDLTFPNELPPTANENFGFIDPLVPLPDYGGSLRAQHGISLQLTHDGANDRLFVADPAEYEEWMANHRVFDPTLLVDDI
jgi:hypothetical protein